MQGAGLPSQQGGRAPVFDPESGADCGPESKGGSAETDWIGQSWGHSGFAAPSRGREMMSIQLPVFHFRPNLCLNLDFYNI